MMTPPESFAASKYSAGAYGMPAGLASEPVATLCPSENALWRQAVLLWMEWHSAQERMTAAMFRGRNDSAQQAELMQEMDQLDQLRWRAVELSQEMLSHPGE